VTGRGVKIEYNSRLNGIPGCPENGHQIRKILPMAFTGNTNITASCLVLVAMYIYENQVKEVKRDSM
jgi:coenzyme F420-reducing hydrogenase gamma subunit